MTRAQMLQKITTLSESQAHGLLKKIFESVPATEELFQAEFTITAKGKASGTKSNTNGKKHDVSFIEKSVIIRALITKSHNREPEILLNGLENTTSQFQSLPKIGTTLKGLNLSKSTLPPPPLISGLRLTLELFLA